jgi:DNA-binding transcriptional ArsR family regulator
MALEATALGCTTSELARRCGVSIAAASQQATVLREAALITTRRVGGAVRHEITPLGMSLLNGTDAAGLAPEPAPQPLISSDGGGAERRVRP